MSFKRERLSDEDNEKLTKYLMRLMMILFLKKLYTNELYTLNGSTVPIIYKIMKKSDSKIFPLPRSLVSNWSNYTVFKTI